MDPTVDTARRRPVRRLAALACASLLLAAAGCGRDAGDTGAAPVAARATATPEAASQLLDWALPAVEAGSATPDLSRAPDGSLLLGWINSRQGRRHVFQFSRFDPAQQRWRTAPATIAIGNRMFVNWADTPHMAATPDGALWAHWLQKSGDAPYAYDIALVRSRDGGANWGSPVVPHDDGTPTEHGFVSMWAQGGDGSIGLAWLDGRNTGAATGHDGHDAAGGDPHGGGGPMTLRAAVFDANLRRTADHEIDASVCDCCQTAAAVTARGPVVVYRGRSDAEIRDILLTRFDGAAWTAPAVVHADNWTMPACPVNGPDVAADGDALLVGWYSAPAGTPLVQLARSDDAGDAFAAPVVLDSGEAVQGRVAVALDAQQAWALWLREEAGVQTLWLSRRSPDLATEYERIEVATLQGRGRATGFPQLQVVDGQGYVVWTDVVDGAPQLRGARIVR
ncbi:glycoside hydrolase [Luteimonas sp. BDR2-5]|uniref:sialidase family protein n=1 Tax=Proluteimonas luteida TaxID=2878685 RepID=UPI001E44A1B3|nr:sialidase family protein [Luteimonas sp. BDR2-5]MCD9029126.1 glycoside hydrolase [Luteimonas sp. BDR2-5]